MPLCPPPYESFEFYGDLFLVQCWDTWSCSRFLDNWEGGRYSMGTSLVISQLKELAKAVSISFMGRKSVEETGSYATAWSVSLTTIQVETASLFGLKLYQ